MGLLLGPKGKFLKAQGRETNTKIYIRGLGSAQPLHVRIEGKEEDAVKEGEKRIKCLIYEITNNPKFITYLQQQQMQDRVLYANDETPINYVQSTFFEDGKWSDNRKLPYEDVLIPELKHGIDPVSLLLGKEGKYPKFLRNFEKLTNTKMMIMGRGTNWENDMPPHFHVVGKCVKDVQEGVIKIKSLQEVKGRN